MRGVIRLSEYEKNSVENDQRQAQKMFSKIVRFCSDQIVSLKAEAKLKDYIIDPSNADYFWIAVQLDRAFQKGEEYAISFLNKLKEIGVVNPELSIHDFIMELCSDLWQGEGFFRYAPIEQYKHEIALYKKINGLEDSEYDYLVNYELSLNK